jgi:hypothetical protein
MISIPPPRRFSPQFSCRQLTRTAPAFDELKLLLNPEDMHWAKQSPLWPAVAVGVIAAGGPQSARSHPETTFPGPSNAPVERPAVRRVLGARAGQPRTRGTC